MAAALCGGHALQAQDRFVVEVEIPGMKNGVKAILVDTRNDKRGDSPLAAGTVEDGRVTLEGQAPYPVLSTLVIDKQLATELAQGDYPQRATADFMLVNGTYRITAAHIDSVALDYEYQSSPLLKEKNVHVETSAKEQAQFADYRKTLFPYEMEQFKAWKALYGRNDNRKLTEQETQKLEKAMADAELRTDSARQAYARAHTGETMAVVLGTEVLEGAFKFTAGELETFVRQIGTVDNPPLMKAYNEKLARARKYLLDTPYTDFAVETPEGTASTLGKLLQNGKPALIDMWASWCGPCRAAIPEVAALHEKYGGRLQIISLSVDRNKKDWEKAMAEEKMPWTQTLATAEGQTVLSENYGLEFIPFMIVINEGKIIASGTPASLEKVIDNLLNP